MGERYEATRYRATRDQANIFNAMHTELGSNQLYMALGTDRKNEIKMFSVHFSERGLHSVLSNDPEWEPLTQEYFALTVNDLLNSRLRRANGCSLTSTDEESVLNSIAACYMLNTVRSLAQVAVNAAGLQLEPQGGLPPLRV